MAYDVMGNITALQRNDKTGAVLNNFAYSYQSEGNKLAGIVDGGTAGQTSNYIYDANGNMVTDSKKGITITYNLLNLPATIATATQSMTYGYDANGTKLYKVVTGTGAIRKDYIGELEATNWSPNFLHTDEGRVIHISGKPVVTSSGVNYAYEYSLKDHLGNTRVTFSSTDPVINGIPTPSIVQDYYPLGSTINPYINSGVNANANQYAYNGKEIQSEIVNLNLYDYGARFYDPVIGRFTTVDPLAEKSMKNSPFVYCSDNSIRFIDPTGMEDGESDTQIAIDKYAEQTGQNSADVMTEFINGDLKTTGSGGDNGSSDGQGDSNQSSGGGITERQATSNGWYDEQLGFNYKFEKKVKESTDPGGKGKAKKKGRSNSTGSEGFDYDKLGSAIVTGTDSYGVALTKANVINRVLTGSKIEGKAFKYLTGSGTVVGAIAGGAPALYHIFNGNATWRDGVALGFAGLGVASEFTMLGVAWDGTVGLGIAAGSLSYDIWDATHPAK